MKNIFKQETIVGMLCGLVFALVAWGYDGLLLAKAHAAIPWLKFAIGIIPCAIAGGLAGWLSMKINNMFARMAIWIAVAVFFTYLTSFIPFKVIPVFYRWMYPKIGNSFVFRAPDAISARRFITTIMTVIFLFIAGLIFENTNDSMRNSRGIVSAAFTLFFLLAFFVGAGYTTDNNFNADLRAPIITMNKKLEYISTVDPATLDEVEQRALKRYTKLDVDFQSPYRLFIITFDDMISSVKVGMDYGGTLAECSVMNGHASSCQMIE